MVETTSAVDRDTLIDQLNQLIHLDFDAIAAYDAAIERLNSPHYQQSLRSFREDHLRHTQNLADCVRRLGGTPATSGDYKKILTKGLVVIASLGNDHSILEAMHTNENQTNALYEKALQKLAGEAEVSEVLRQNLEDERRHRDWIIATLDSMR